MKSAAYQKCTLADAEGILVVGSEELSALYGTAMTRLNLAYQHIDGAIATIKRHVDALAGPPRPLGGDFKYFPYLRRPVYRARIQRHPRRSHCLFRDHLEILRADLDSTQASAFRGRR